MAIMHQQPTMAPFSNFASLARERDAERSSAPACGDEGFEGK